MPLTEDQLITKIRGKLTTIGAALRPAPPRPRPKVIDKVEAQYNAAVRKCKASNVDPRKIVIDFVNKQKW